MDIKDPVMHVIYVPIEKIIANNYNPNVVATPEFKLLVLSIQSDGYTQPIVTFYDNEIDKYIIVDGFHRHKAGLFLERKELPIVVIDKPIDDRMASTIRHNRARGTHQIDAMSEITKILIESGKIDAWITKNLGMDKDEVLRLKQLTGIAELFKNHEYSKSWEAE